MRRGFSLTELTLTLAVVAVVTSVALPHVAGVLDWIAVDAVATKVTAALAVTRNTAIMRGVRTRLVVAPDSLRIDAWNGGTWAPLARWSGCQGAGVLLEVSNPVVVFGPTGIGWGASNTTIVLRRGSRFKMITISRLGRVKRW